MKSVSRIVAPIVLLLIMGISIGACSNDSCYDNGSSLPLATFYVGNSQQTINGLTIMGIGAPGDSLLLDSATVKEAYLPLRASQTATSFLVRHWRTNGIDRIAVNDTLSIDYQPIEYFHSIECGAMFNYDIKLVTCTFHGIDSIVLVKDFIDNSRTPAIRIHFRP